MTDAPMTSSRIRTPDQRLRVFVSSTLVELADERAAVAKAVSALRLTPVLFELGARPHPPRDLYRAYLDQSDIFIGLYWQRYGWVAPDMDISGLEDEYELSKSLPRLLYMKTPAPEREARLAAMLDRITAESYRSFRTTRELGRLVREDLAMLLSERFAAGAPPSSSTRLADRPHPRRSLPVATTSLIGREQHIEEISRLLDTPSNRLVTLTGPGGIGKTRLAVAVAERLGDRYPSGTAFVPLASLTEPRLALASIAAGVGASIEGAQSPLGALAEHLADAQILLVLDNLEQVVSIAPDLDELLARCPGVTILATSRTVLRLRAEREYPVPALAVPSHLDQPSTQELASLAAVELFVDRARAVRPDFALTEDNVPAVAEICRRLDGVPLAIELAAARIRLLEPDALLDRLGTRLDALGRGPVDLPERQRTLRATVEWSVGLLTDDERRMLSTLAVFVDGWDIDATVEVGGLAEGPTLDLLDALAGHSLVEPAATEDGPRFRMLDVVREFAAEQLVTTPDLAEVEQRHAWYFRDLVERADRHLRGADQYEWAERLQVELGNLRAVIRWFFAHDIAPLPHVFRVLWMFWELREHMVEGRAWVVELLPRATTLSDQAQAELLSAAAATGVEVGDDAAALAAAERLEQLLDRIDDPYLKAISQLTMAWALPLRDDFDGALRAGSESLDQLRQQDEPLMTALVARTVGSIELQMGYLEQAQRHLTEADELGQRLGNHWLLAGNRVQTGTLAVMQGRLDEARALLHDALSLNADAELDTRSVVSCLVALASLARVDGELQRAALALGAAEGLRRREGLRVYPGERRWEAELLAQVEEALGRDRFQEAFAEGSKLTRRETIGTLRDLA